MPCYEVQRTKVQLKAENAQLLVNALRASEDFNSLVVNGTAISVRHKATGSVVRIINGEAVVETRSASINAVDVANAVNRAYSTEVVKKMSSRFGWTLKQTETSKFVAAKRY